VSRIALTARKNPQNNRKITRTSMKNAFRASSPPPPFCFLPPLLFDFPPSHRAFAKSSKVCPLSSPCPAATKREEEEVVVTALLPPVVVAEESSLLFRPMI
jgi:hypothetical protein